jgi:putative flippase GtrA
MIKKFVKYSIVGVSGTLIDFLTLIFQVEILKVNLYIAVVISFLLAATSNHYFNRRYTFQSQHNNYFNEYRKFVSVAVSGVLINIIAVYLIVGLMSFHYLFAKVLVTGVVLIWNFLMNYHWTFEEHIRNGKNK